MTTTTETETADLRGLLHSPPPAMTDEHFARLAYIVRERSGVRYPSNRKAELASRLAHRLRELELATFDEYLKLLTTGPLQQEEFQALYDRLGLTRSWLFSNAIQLDVFERRVLPRLIEARKSTRRLRVWSAGCAGGEEAATIAIIIHRTLGVRLEDWRVEILGTDLSERAVRSAGTGCFAEASLRATPAPVRHRYFTRERDGGMLHESVRSMLSFEQRDLRDVVGARRLGPFDVILCRDVLTHLDPDASSRVMDSVADAIAPDGRLFLGSGERVDERASPFALDPIGQSACYALAAPATMQRAA